MMAQGRCVRGNCFNGEGTLRMADGAEYVGAFKKGKFEGLGRLVYPDGTQYLGNFHDNLQEGKGRLIEVGGNQYFGFWHRGLKHGEGEMTYADGTTIAGNWTNGKMDGQIEFKFGNGDTYIGDMVADQMHGQGTMEYVSGDVYTGAWSYNKPSGAGKIVFANGFTLSGNWKNGAYETNWAAMGYQGNRAGLTDCTNGCNSNRGRYVYADGSEYLGDIVNGQPNGTGTVVYPNGDTYRGSFQNHRPNGLGVMYYATGKVEGAIWENGKIYRQLYSKQDAAVASAPAAPYDPAVKVWAVVVGCAYYQHMRTLRYTDDDAYQLYAFLKSVEGGALPDNQVRILVDENAKQRDIINAMRETYSQADENDVILFYFSGHGLPGAFLPVDYDGRTNALKHQDINDALLASRSRHKLVIADACHSGSLAGRNAKSGGGGADQLLNSYYTALNNAQASTALLMSSKGKEISLEDGGLRSGVFSHYLIRGMKGLADTNNDNLVSIRELFNYVHREVRNYTGNIQTPTLTGTYDDLMPVSAVRAR